VFTGSEHDVRQRPLERTVALVAEEQPTEARGQRASVRELEPVGAVAVVVAKCRAVGGKELVDDHLRGTRTPRPQNEQTEQRDDDDNAYDAID